jgi:nucleoside permease NupC
MGLIIGSFEVIVPHRIGEITQHILRGMIAGTVASYLTACFAGTVILFDQSTESIPPHVFYLIKVLLTIIYFLIFYKTRGN